MNPLNNFNLSQGVDSLKQKLLSPYNKYLSAEERKSLLKQAHDRHDFKDGLTITPYGKSGKPVEADIVRLVADAMPHDKLTFGGTQKLVKNYYPGNSEPTVQVLGPQESDITITGRFKAKKLRAKDAEEAEKWRQYAVLLQEQVDSIRINGFLVQISLGAAWHRFGFIEECSFGMKNLSDIEYSIRFFIVGFNKPSDYIQIENTRVIPYNTNKKLAKDLTDLQLKLYKKGPPTLPKSFADQINGAISDVASAVNLVTGFVDTVLGEVNSLKASVQRALGLVKNARNKISGYQRDIGGKKPDGGIPKTTNVSGSYANAAYVASVSASMFSLTALLASLAVQLKAVTATVPMARHRVQSGDTLHSLAMKYYNDASHWSDIYDHNKLTSSTLVVGSILEIPKI